jgi:hypothetical protein
MSETTTRAFKQAIIREQLKRVLPSVEQIYILFCAVEMAKQIEGFKYSEKFEGGKC